MKNKGLSKRKQEGEMETRGRGKDDNKEEIQDKEEK